MIAGGGGSGLTIQQRKTTLCEEPTMR
jgi:hypothetical protein